jgi:hypothetical protein
MGGAEDCVGSQGRLKTDGAKTGIGRLKTGMETHIPPVREVTP